MSEKGISHTRELFDMLNTALEAAPLPTEINDLLEKGALDLSTHTYSQEDPKRLLSNIKRILVEQNPDSQLDYDLLLQLLNNIISICSFEDVLATFTIDDLEMALTSSVAPLVVAACKVIAKSYPRGIFANSVICDILLKLFFDANVSISIVNSIEQTIATLSSDELIRRRVLVNNSPLLMAIRKQFEPISSARLLELLNIEAAYLTNSEFNEKLFVIRSEEISKSLEVDIVMFIHITAYYTKLLEEVFTQGLSQTHPRKWLLKYILPIIPSFGKIYEKREEFTDVKFFAKSYLFKLFRKVSYLDDESVFASLDRDYIHISKENEHINDFLSFVNPEYLYNHYQSLIIELTSVVPSHLGILRNLIANERCFSLIKDQLTASAILAMPYMEQMVLLQKLSQFSHSVHYLLEYLPKVMSSLLYNENGEVTETESANLRREILENLLKYDKDTLNVWYSPVRDEYKRIVQGTSSNEAQVNLASSYL
ncbi:ZYRO0B09328p [Zygosaccharomyces rouxii]|uniref:DNA mismatch repair protein HSM3 n=1 Tax=Zygosaccharomyces rouxii (strain ATCC 2623 / CBS 732 / NBRC 1130 / NCYC 568 / NRRL Y-229) TaxID=559307 RepID=C5DRL2_ZYGRC|nr:uncharacterized protein ZYRO0B09328g [Zygosaccharomyces rouxii]KAH9200042.1 hypothetical protein LQ764DRAFT_111988 [Zygosaccharomyces rouxii]CAR26423.1 ZYRO0B09328p [Zygosaccharomyces rouxii]